MAWLTASWMAAIPEFRSIEEWFGPGEELLPRYEMALDALRSGEADAWFAECAKAGVTEESTDHFRAHWMGGEMFPWVDADRMRSRLQEGFVAALEEARELGLPISIAWVGIEGTDPGFFDVRHIAGANAVTIIMATPRPQPSKQVSS